MDSGPSVRPKTPKTSRAELQGSREPDSQENDPDHPSGSKGNTRLDRIENLLLEMKREQSEKMNEVVAQCDKKLEGRLDKFRESFFKELKQDKDVYFDTVSRKVKDYVGKHEIRRENRIKTLVQTSIKHYVAASLDHHLGKDACSTIDELDRLEPVLSENIQWEISLKSKRSPGQNPSQPLRLNDSFLEIQNEFTLADFTSPNPHCPFLQCNRP